MVSGDPPASGPADPTGNREGVPRTDRAIVISVEPDICLDAGGSPTAFNLYALPSDDAQTAPTVRLNNLRAHVRTSLITVSHGDEAGVGGGVQSGTHNGICEPKTWSNTVFAENKQMIRHSDEWWMNDRNTYGKVYYIRDTALYPRWQAEQGRGQSPAGPALAFLAAPPAEEAEAEVAAAKAELEAADAEIAAAEAEAAAAAEGEGETEGFLWEFGPLEWIGAGVVAGGTLLYFGRLISQARKKAEAAKKRLEAAQAAQKRTQDIVRVTGEAKTEKDEICEAACQCKADRGSSRTLTDCVAEKLRRKYYDPDGPKYPDGSPRRPTSPTADGPRPEVSYDPKNGFKQIDSASDPDMPSSQVPIRGAPRPDISWWSGGKLRRIFELKFGDDEDTIMQMNGSYRSIALANGLNPDVDLIRMNIDDDCECTSTGGRAK